MQRITSAALVVLAFSLFFTPNATKAAGVLWPPDTTPRQINITSDSAPGWVPTASQMAAMRATANEYLTAKDDGRFFDSYQLLTKENEQSQPLASFADAAQKFNLLSGPVKERRVVKVTWTKDPVRAPAPGIYAAVDDVSRFANIDRHCGYLILYQPPGGDSFKILREEANFLDNATALKIEQQHSRADVDRAWAQLSAHCPK